MCIRKCAQKNAIIIRKRKIFLISPHKFPFCRQSPELQGKNMKNYRLAVDENGSPFVLNSKGSIDFGYITEEMNLPAAPIRVAEGDESYGLALMVKNHTLFISLSRTEDYWNVISGGVFRLKYSRNKKKVYSVPAIRMPEPVSQAKVPASGEIQQDSTEASGDSL